MGLKHTRLGNGHEICHDALELGRGHLDGGGILGFGNSQVLLVNVHELEVVFGDPLGFDVLELQVEHIGRVLGLEGEDIFVSCRPQHLCERGQVETERDVAVATIGRKAAGPENHGYKRDMAVIHRLQRDSTVIAVEVAVLYEILDRIDDL